MWPYINEQIKLLSLNNFFICVTKKVIVWIYGNLHVVLVCQLTKQRTFYLIGLQWLKLKEDLVNGLCHDWEYVEHLLDTKVHGVKVEMS